MIRRDVGRRGPKPVLVVEDNEDLQELVRTILRSSGYPVVCADNGADALLRLRAGLLPSLILLDLYMPVLDGFEFRAEQLKDPSLAAIPTVVFSGGFDVRGEATRLKVDDYFQKPVHRAQIIEKVRKYVLQ
jgi:CheY-like chemotaxis protein